MRLTSAGQPLGIENAIVGRVSTIPLAEHTDRTETVFVSSACTQSASNLRGYRAIVTQARADVAHPLYAQTGVPTLHSVRDIDHLRDRDVVVLQPSTGFIRTLYRPDSVHNSIFVTERCNSNCLMCSQPPKDKDDSQHFVETNLELIKFIDPQTSYLGITGGEPTLLRQGLFRILIALRDALPDTRLHMLTNGRLFAWKEFTREFAEVRHPNLVLGIPLYSDYAAAHDYVVQAKHAFDQTVMGLHQLARWETKIEIRVVLHRLTMPRLEHLMEYIARNFPFVVHVALMGLEPTGYTPANREKLWIDPISYQDDLERAIESAALRGLNVSLYNSQLCLLRPSLWKFARKSISDWKNVYMDECSKCSALDACGGLFQSALRMHSEHIHAILPRDEEPAQRA